MNAKYSISRAAMIPSASAVTREDPTLGPVIERLSAGRNSPRCQRISPHSASATRNPTHRRLPSVVKSRLEFTTRTITAMDTARTRLTPWLRTIFLMLPRLCSQINEGSRTMKQATPIPATSIRPRVGSMTSTARLTASSRAVTMITDGGGPFRNASMSSGEKNSSTAMISGGILVPARPNA